MTPAKTLTITPELERADGIERVQSTGVQVGGATAVVGAVKWLAQEFTGWDGDMPPEVFGYFVALLTIVASGLKNRRKIVSS